MRIAACSSSGEQEMYCLNLLERKSLPAVKARRAVDSNAGRPIKRARALIGSTIAAGIRELSN